jgi:hypothetical protein
VYAAESGDIVIKQDSADRGDTALVTVHPGQVDTLVPWLQQAKAEAEQEQAAH